mmetsp:Transcript_46008/g.144147  ORF Transcript_46008/g.144147 Transcript_46008/m.144147 type:complete len:86 (-) Transcript_46008:1599-1856(-)
MPAGRRRSGACIIILGSNPRVNLGVASAYAQAAAVAQRLPGDSVHRSWLQQGLYGNIAVGRLGALIAGRHAGVWSYDLLCGCNSL